MPHVSIEKVKRQYYLLSSNHLFIRENGGSRDLDDLLTYMREQGITLNHVRTMLGALELAEKFNFVKKEENNK